VEKWKKKPEFAAEVDRHLNAWRERVFLEAHPELATRAPRRPRHPEIAVL
jgi:hypothetical protein